MSKNPEPSPVIFSTDDYVIPQWSAMPKYNFFFQVIKDGIIITNLPIKNKEFSLIGRLQDLCDLYIDNPTVSRKHAVLQFQQNQPLPYLYDLGNTHGTYVNKEKLTPKVYKKLELFSNIKFGVSSRYFILRCPELEEKDIVEEEHKQEEFIKTLNQQNKILSKQQAKKKYLELLENDPYFGGQLKSRKFQGEIKNQQKSLFNNSKDQGISWGIQDQNQVYAFTNDKQFPIQPDVIRRLPGLDSTMLQKLAQYEAKFRIYDEIQSQLNQLSNKQKRQYGLQQKLQNKKQKLQKKFVQSLQALQKCQQWIKVHIFGDEEGKNNNKKKEKQKEADTYSDDQFYDRTLENKRQKAEGKNDKNVEKVKNKHVQIVGVEDLWKLKNNFISSLKRKKQLVQQSNMILNEIKKTQLDQQNQQQDQFQLFMKQNNQNLQKQNESTQKRQLEQLEQKLKELKSSLSKFLSIKQIQKLEQQTLQTAQSNPVALSLKQEFNKFQNQQRQQKQRQKHRQSLGQKLMLIEREQKKLNMMNKNNKVVVQKGKRLELIKKKIREQGENGNNNGQVADQYPLEEQLQENDPRRQQQQEQQNPQRLFQLYKQQQRYRGQMNQDYGQGQDEYEQNGNRKRQYAQDNQREENYKIGRKMVHLDGDGGMPGNLQQQQEDQKQQEVVDLTQRFNR